MKRCISIFILIIGWAGLYGQSQYSITPELVCWNINDIDSTIARISLYNSYTGARQILSYYNATGDQVTPSGGTFSFGNCCCNSSGGSGASINSLNVVNDTTNNFSVIQITDSNNQTFSDTIIYASTINNNVTDNSVTIEQIGHSFSPTEENFVSQGFESVYRDSLGIWRLADATLGTDTLNPCPRMKWLYLIDIPDSNHITLSWGGKLQYNHDFRYDRDQRYWLQADGTTDTVPNFECNDIIVTALDSVNLYLHEQRGIVYSGATGAGGVGDTTNVQAVNGVTDLDPGSGKLFGQGGTLIQNTLIDGQSFNYTLENMDSVTYESQVTRFIRQPGLNPYLVQIDGQGALAGISFINSGNVFSMEGNAVGNFAFKSLLPNTFDYISFLNNPYIRFFDKYNYGDIAPSYAAGDTSIQIWTGTGVGTANFNWINKDSLFSFGGGVADGNDWLATEWPLGDVLINSTNLLDLNSTSQIRIGDITNEGAFMRMDGGFNGSLNGIWSIGDESSNPFLDTGTRIVVRPQNGFRYVGIWANEFVIDLERDTLRSGNWLVGQGGIPAGGLVSYRRSNYSFPESLPDSSSQISVNPDGGSTYIKTHKAQGAVFTTSGVANGHFRVQHNIGDPNHVTMVMIDDSDNQYYASVIGRGPDYTDFVLRQRSDSTLALNIPFEYFYITVQEN